MEAIKRYKIEEAKYGISDSAGPSEGSVIVGVKYHEEIDGKETESKWLYNSEFEGVFTKWMLLDENDFDILIEDNWGDDYLDRLNGSTIEEIDGIVLGDKEGYEELLESINENPESPAVPLVRFVLALTRCDEDKCDELIANGINHYADEIEIPECDVEEEYMEENEEF